MARINKAVDMLAQGQPIYYTGAEDRSYEGGRAAAKTWADYITFEMEHGAYDVRGLHEFMRGLVDGGPTASGHRTPAVIVTLPATGADEQAFRANAWMVSQVLAAGVHGILLCHAESPAAIRAFVDSTRYPFVDGGTGRRGGPLRGKKGPPYQGSGRLVCRRPIAAASAACLPAPTMTPAAIWSTTFSGVTCSRNASLLALHAARALFRAATICGGYGGSCASGSPSDMPMSPGPHSAKAIPGTAATFSAFARARVFSIFKPNSSSPSGLSGHGSARFR